MEERALKSNLFESERDKGTLKTPFPKENNMVPVNYPFWQKENF